MPLSDKIHSIFRTFESPCSCENDVRKDIREYVQCSCTHQTRIATFDRYLEEPMDINVPCGKCYNCRNSKANDTMSRLWLDANVLQHAYFVTLTYKSYDTAAEIPDRLKSALWHYDNVNRQHRMCWSPCLLDISHVQKFLARLRHILRKRNNGVTPIVEYFECGEYGHLYARCHWHLILLCEVDIFEEDIVNAWSYHKVPFGRIDYQDLFADGTMAEVNGHSSRKCFKYVSKYVQKDDKFPTSRLKFAYDLYFGRPDLSQYVYIDMPQRLQDFMEEKLSEIINEHPNLNYEDPENYSDAYLASCPTFTEFRRLFAPLHSLSTGCCLGSLYFRDNLERFLQGNLRLPTPTPAVTEETAQGSKRTSFRLSFPRYYSYLLARHEERFVIRKRSDEGVSSSSRILAKTDLSALRYLCDFAHTFPTPRAYLSYSPLYFEDCQVSSETPLGYGLFRLLPTRQCTTKYCGNSLYDSLNAHRYEVVLRYTPDFSKVYACFKVSRYDRKLRKFIFIKFVPIYDVITQIEFDLLMNEEQHADKLQSIIENNMFQQLVRDDDFVFYMYEAEKALNDSKWEQFKTRKYNQQINFNKYV